MYNKNNEEYFKRLIEIYIEVTINGGLCKFGLVDKRLCA